MPTDKIILYAGWKIVVDGKEYGNQILLEGPEKDAQALESLRDNLNESLEKIKNGLV